MSGNEGTLVPTQMVTQANEDPMTHQSLAQSALARDDLSFEEFSNYLDAYFASMRRGLKTANESFAKGDFLAAKKSFANLRELCLGLNAKGKRMIGQSSQVDSAGNVIGDASSVAELNDVVEQSSEFAKWMANSEEVCEGVHQRLRGNSAGSVEAFERSIRILDTLPEGAEFLGLTVDIHRAVSQYQQVIARAILHMMFSRLQEAQSESLDACVKIEKLISRVESLNRSIGKDETLEFDNIVKLANSDRISATNLYDLAVMLGAIQEGNFRTAADATQRMVDNSKIAAENLPEGVVPEPLLRLQHAEQGLYKGYNCYVRGELATDEGEWSKALDLLEEARQTWRDAATRAISTGMPEGRAIAEKLLNLTTVQAHAASRRCHRERLLNQRIAELEKKLDLLKQVNIQRVGDLTMSNDFVGGDKVGRDKVGGDKVGGSNMKAGGSIVLSPDAGRFLDHSRELSKSSNSDEIKAALEALQQQVEALAKKLPDEDSQVAATRKLKQLTEEVTAKNPDKGFLDVTGKGLIEAAKTVAEMVAPVTTAVKGVLALFGMRI